MKRRTFIFGLTWALTTPILSEAQKAGTIPRVGALALHSREQIADIVEDIDAGLRDQGWVRGQNILVEWRFANGRALPVRSTRVTLLRGSQYVPEERIWATILKSQ